MTHTLYHGDAIEVLAGLADNSIDSIVQDPPSSINFMGLHWDNDKGGRDQWIAWLSSIMKQCYRVLKPGGHAAVWALPRTSHWTGMALELSGFEVRDCISYLYDSGCDVTAFLETLSPEQRNMLEIILANGDSSFSSFLHCFGSGFPKSANIGKMIDKSLGMEREVIGLAADFARDGAKRKVDGSHVKPTNQVANGDRWSQPITAPSSPEAKQHDGWGSNLKPAFENWWLVRKPLSEPTIAANVLRWGVGGLNIDGSRVPTNDGLGGGGYVTKVGDGWDRPFRHDESKADEYANKLKEAVAKAEALGRFPSNIVIDGSDPVEAEFAKAGVRSSGANKAGSVFNLNRGGYAGGNGKITLERDYEASTGSASRFFYCAKPSSRERNEGLDSMNNEQLVMNNGTNDGSISRNIHPTVKSISLCNYLITMITPKGGTVLDCFMGSGSTGVAAMKSGFKFVGIEKERNYFEIAEARIRHANLGQQGTIIAPEPLPVNRKPKLQMEMF